MLQFPLLDALRSDENHCGRLCGKVHHKTIKLLW
jgi:hypothetical protein